MLFHACSLSSLKRKISVHGIRYNIIKDVLYGVHCAYDTKRSLGVTQDSISMVVLVKSILQNGLCVNQTPKQYNAKRELHTIQ